MKHIFITGSVTGIWKSASPPPFPLRRWDLVRKYDEGNMKKYVGSMKEYVENMKAYIPAVKARRCGFDSRRRLNFFFQAFSSILGLSPPPYLCGNMKKYVENMKKYVGSVEEYVENMKKYEENMKE